MTTRRQFLSSALLAMPAQAAGLWQSLREGKLVVLMRHAATTPGVGDPPGFQLGRCNTQRNLSERGRADAVLLGKAFRTERVPVAAVLSSRWCRCLDTAQLAFGRAEPASMLDSMFEDDEASRQGKLAALRRYLVAFGQPGNLVLVTHDVNIRALVGQYVNQGDSIVARRQADGTLAPIGTLSIAAILASLRYR